MNELKAKPCWYCGEDEQLSVVPQCTFQELADCPLLVQTFAVQCAACAAQGPQWTDAETAINLWNHREVEDALQKRIDELEDEVGLCRAKAIQESCSKPEFSEFIKDKL